MQHACGVVSRRDASPPLRSTIGRACIVISALSRARAEPFPHVSGLVGVRGNLSRQSPARHFPVFKLLFQFLDADKHDILTATEVAKTINKLRAKADWSFAIRERPLEMATLALINLVADRTAT